MSAQKVIAVVYRRWSFNRGSNCKALTGKIAVYWFGGHLGGGLLREVVAQGGSTVYRIKFHVTLPIACF